VLAKRAKAIERSRSASATVGPCLEINSLLSNARCLGEGVDIRAIDGVGLIDPRKSNIDIIQAVGRAIRKSDQSKIGPIVLPVLIDGFADNEVDERLNSSRSPHRGSNYRTESPRRGSA
jgi:predicted helicase